MPNINKVKDWLRGIGFRPIDGKSNRWNKTYINHEDYEIAIDLAEKNQEESKINWGKKINVVRGTTSNFKDDETLVVLECVDRLLIKGYSPETITLEKDWPLGHCGKGFLDILIKDLEHNESFLMIECKVWGAKYEEEKSKMLSGKGQLFTYYVEEPTTKYLCLYTSKIDKDLLEYKNDIVYVQEDFVGKNQETIFELWNKDFIDNGIFEEKSIPYDLKFRRIIFDDLKDLNADDSRKIFSDFESILRKYVVSDKPNAFNKIFNLFLCKIVDEDNRISVNDEMEFQWQPNDNIIKNMNTLNDLYKQGMERYLNLKISDYSEKEITSNLDRLESLGTDNTEIKKMFDTLRLYRNSDFSFSEVFDEKSFYDNAFIVKEVVRLLQKKRIKYSSKHQFLGDFFERLLNTSIKQESGQYFTPIPIAKFICSSLPYQNIIEEKIKGKEAKFLPYIIDYASGSGHFLTESMDIVQKTIEGYDGNNFTKIMRDNLNIYKVSYSWASEFVFGIEKDYRLAKTTKVSCFLNGDGEANITIGDGLDNFYNGVGYNKKLMGTKDSMDNQQFDIVVANPPYAVPGFKNIIRGNGESFELYQHLTDKSQEIECLFVERTKQLLKDKGVAGIVLPSSILSNTSSIYTATREMILKYFYVKAIVEFGTSTFMATPIKTVVLFLKRRANSDHKRIKDYTDIFFSEYKDMTVDQTEKAFEKYISCVWKTINFEEYIQMLQAKFSPKVKESDPFKDYKYNFEKSQETKIYIKTKDFNNLPSEGQEQLLNCRLANYILVREQEKLYYFLITMNQRTILVKSGEDKKRERAFLGYEFDNSRNDAGIKLKIDSKGHINSLLYDEMDLANSSKINAIIHNNFLNKKLSPISEELRHHVQERNLSELINFRSNVFIKEIGTSFIKANEYTFESSVNLISLEELGFKFQAGVVYEKNEEQYTRTNKKLLTSANINLVSHSLDFQSPIYLTESLEIDENKKLRKGDIYICVRSGSMSHLGKTAFIHENMDYYYGAFCATLRNDNYELSKYISELLTLQEFDKYVRLNSKQNINMLSKEHILKFRVPNFQTDVISEINSTCKEYDDKVKKAQKQEEAYNSEYEQEINSWNRREMLSQICQQIRKQIDPQKKKKEKFYFVGLENIVSNTGKCIDISETLGEDIKSVKNTFEEGDVLYGKLRPYLNKVAMADQEGICSTDILVLRTKNNFPATVLKRILLSKEVLEFASEQSKGMRQPRISPEKLMKLEIPIPDDINKAKKRVESISNNIDETQNKIKQLLLEKEEFIRSKIKG